MKALKIIGIIILVIVALFLVIALFLPNSTKMEESIVINKPASLIYKQVNNYKNWEAWSPFQASDTSMVVTYEGPDKGVGAKMSWTSKGGDGYMLNTECVPYKQITSDLDFGMPGAKNIFTFEEGQESTKVTWIVDIPKLGYPAGRYIGLMMPGMMKTVFLQGLEKLKEITEAMPDPPALEIVELPEISVLSIIDSCYWNDMEMKMDEMFTELMTAQVKTKSQMAGPPFSIYYKWDEVNMFSVFENCIPVDREVASKGRVQYKVIPGTRALRGIHYGSYDQTMYMYVALEEYVKDFGLEETGGPIQQYVTDPTMEPDTAMWQTNIYFPVK